jgi:hypothetical protein
VPADAASSIRSLSSGRSDLINVRARMQARQNIVMRNGRLDRHGDVTSAAFECGLARILSSVMSVLMSDYLPVGPAQVRRVLSFWRGEGSSVERGPVRFILWRAGPLEFL